MEKELTKKKIKVVHILPTLGYGGIARMLYSFFEKIDKSRFEFYFIHFGERVDYHEKIEELGGKIISIQPINQVGFKGMKRNFQRVLKEECSGCHIIHIHLNYLSGLVAKWAKDAGVDHRICHIRGVLIEGRKRYLLSIYRLLIRRYCTEFLAVSRESGQFYYGKNFPFKVINNGLDYEVFKSGDIGEISRVKESCKISDDDFVVAQIGRLSHEKNHIFTLELINALRNKGIPAVLVVAGDGDERENITVHTKKLGISPYVHLLGNRSDIQNIYYLCNCLVLPSISEGMPNVVLQAQCAGKPAIISNTVTRDVDLGLGLVDFCALNNMDAWINRIESIYKARYSTVCQERIYQQLKANSFLLEDEVSKLEKLYAGLGDT